MFPECAKRHLQNLSEGENRDSEKKHFKDIIIKVVNTRQMLF